MMNSLEIVRLAKSKAARELTLQEVKLLREAVASTPELYHLLGGKEEFERYMAEAPDVAGMSAEEIAVGESPDGESQESAPGGSRRIYWMAACVVILIIAAAGAWKYLVARGMISPKDAPRERSGAHQAEKKQRRESNESRRAATVDKTLPAGDRGPAGNQPVQPLPGTYPLFEDEGRFVATDGIAAGDELVAPLAEDDRYSGQCSVRVVPSNRFRLEFNQSLPIRANPGEGEYRYLRFAFRKFGSGRLCLELDGADGEAPAIRYDAGQGPPSHGGAHRVWALELPSEWIVMTCDVFRDFGAGDITALTLSVPDGDYALFDHIYLERTIDGLDGIAGAPSVELTNQQARRVLAKEPLSIAGPAVVGLEANGQRGTGVLIGKQGYVLTCAHHLFALKSDITVRLADGRTVKGRKAGTCRNADCGVIRIVEQIGRQGLEISDNGIHTPQDLHVAFSVTPEFNDGRTASYVVEIEPDADKMMLWTEFEMEGAELGGPLVDRSGRVVGIHVRTSEDGKMGFAKLTRVRAEWERLTRDESVGQWLPGSGPMIGVVSTAIGEGSRIDRVLPGSPAATAGLQVGDVIVKVDGHGVRSYLDIGRQLAGYDPGDTAAFLLHRDGQEILKKIRLMHRQEFPAP